MRKKNCETRSCAPAPLRRALLAAAAIGVALMVATPRATAQLAMTTVQGTIYRADGTPASGTVLFSWNAFTTPQNQAVAAGSVSAAIGADGFLSVNLTPNTGALPTGSYYTAVYHLSDGTVYSEYWVVPASGTASVASVRAQLEPSTVAVASSVTPAYVQDALASLSATYLPITGGTLTGALTLNADPSAQNQAATRHYVDQSAAQELPLSGGTLTGALTVPSLFTKTLEGRLYADQWQSPGGTGNNGMAMSLAECATYSYACQVLAPAMYAQTEAEPWGGAFQWSGGQSVPFVSTPLGPAYGQPAGCIRDDRFGGPQWICQPMAPPSWAANPGNAVGPSFTLYGTQTTTSGYWPHGAALAVNDYNFAGTTYNVFQPQVQALRVFQVSDAPAGSQGLWISQFSNANGDTEPFDIFHFQRGGLSTGDSEGDEGRYLLQEAPDVYQGTVNSIVSVTPAAPDANVCGGYCTIFSTAQTQGYKGSLGDGLELIDLTQADSSGYISLISASASGGVTAAGADWDTKFGDSVAHSTLTAQTPAQTSANPLLPLTNVTLSVASAAGFTVGGNACLIDYSGSFWENEPITAVSTANNTLSVGVLNSVFGSGSSVSEGGMACMGLEMVADEVSPGNMNGQYSGQQSPVSTLRTVWPIAWNAAGNTLYMPYSNEGHAFTSGRTLAYSQMGSGGNVTCTLSGGAIASCTASGGTGYSSAADSAGNLRNPPSLTISGLTGCTSTPALYVSSVASGAISAVTIGNSGTSGCTGTPAVTVTPANSYAVYPMARTFNVYNPLTGKVDGSSIATDMPAGTFSAGDTVEEEEYPIETDTLHHEYEADWRGGATMRGQYVAWGGRNSGATYSTLMNPNSPTLYAGYPFGTPWVAGQGQMTAPSGYSLTGAWGTGISLQEPPFGNTLPGAVAVGCLVNGVDVCTGWNAWSVVINHANQQNNGSASDVLEYNPSTESWQWTAGASGSNGSGAGCTLDFNSGGFSGNCGGHSWSFDATGDLALAGSLHALSGITGAAINGEITVDGQTYPTLNSAWSAAVAQANATGQDQTVRLGPGTFAVSATLTEPTGGSCVNLLGSAGMTVNADSPQVATTLSVPSPLGGDLFYLTSTAQAQGCTFQNFNVLANGNATHAFELQWFRGLLIDNVSVNDTSSDGIVLGEESTASGHQANFLLRNVTVSFSASTFTPASRPAYGIHMEKTAMDSALDEITVRNALTAAVYNEGTGNTGYLIHGFGYPYTCTTAPCVNNASSASAANASYASSYVIYDTGGSGSGWTDTYVDSPAVSGFYVGANGISIEGGHVQWPDLTSFPAANLAYIAPAVTNNLLLGDVTCLGMASGVNWITYAGSSGNPPTFSSVHHLTGCGNYYQALEPAVTLTRATFTGAAILLREKAAYRDTSFALAQSPAARCRLSRPVSPQPVHAAPRRPVFHPQFRKEEAWNPRLSKSSQAS